MWEQGRAKIEEVFFKDAIEIYENEIEYDQIGEAIETKTLKVATKANVQDNATTVTNGVSGQSTPQNLRISIPKAITLEKDATYVIKVKVARIPFDSGYLKVVSTTEGMLSTVIIASKEGLV